MKSIGAEFLRPDALPGTNHMRGMQSQIVLNVAFCPELNNTVGTNLFFLHKTSTLINNVLFKVQYPNKFNGLYIQTDEIQK